jgi:hypothetical protein
MKKTLALAFVLLLIVVIAADAAVIKVKVATANIRSKPDLMAPVITRANQGALFEVQKKIGTWYEISAVDDAGNIVTGYISADVVEEIGGGEPAQPQPAAPTPAPAAAKPAASYYSGGAKAAGGIIVGAGPVFSNFSYDSETQQSLSDFGITKKMKFGFQLGASYDIPISEGLFVSPGAYFSTGGCTLTSGGDTAKIALSGIVIPIEIKVAFGGGPFIAAGPYVGFLVSAKTIDSAGNSTDITDINKTHFGLTFGAGYEMPMGANAIVIKLAYQLGLSNLNNNANSSDTGWTKHNAITLLFGLRI